MTHFEIIKKLNFEELADFLHNVQESTVKNGYVKSTDDWKVFLSKEIGK